MCSSDLYFSATIFFSSSARLAYNSFLLLIFGSPSEKELRIENTRLLAQYNVLSHRLDEAMGVMQDIQPVSYTHLDVYKRQIPCCIH